MIIESIVKKQNYTSTDLGIILPTKDRPEQLKKALQSISDQTVSCGRILVVASGTSVESVVMEFSNSLPVEYIQSSLPGQVRQRNIGIKELNSLTKLVAFLDDDVFLFPDAFEKIIQFINSKETEIGGVGFNIISAKKDRSVFRKFMNLDILRQGQVLASGYNTSIINVSQSIRTSWLNGGATVWKQEIVKNNVHQEINSYHAIREDVIFSYPIGKKHSLYICAEAKAVHAHITSNVASTQYFGLGRKSALWHIYFVTINADLSLSKCISMLFFTSSVRAFLFLFRINVAQFFFNVGRLWGMLSGLFYLTKKGKLISILSDW
jgi:glycosyltransferase involved in cell wall biosynthesis